MDYNVDWFAQHDPSASENELSLLIVVEQNP